MINLNETILRDIIDIKNSISMDELDFIKTSKSVSREASNGILQFPVLVSTSLPLQDVTMISKALERQFVSFVAILTSTQSVTDAKSINKYLKRIHQNVNKKQSIFHEDVRLSYPNPNREFISLISQSEKNTICVAESVGIEGYDTTGLKSIHPNTLSEEDKNVLAYIINDVKMGSKAFMYSEDTGINSVVITNNDGITQIIPVENEDSEVTFIQSNLANTKEMTVVNEGKSANIISAMSKTMLKEHVNDLNMEILNNKTRSNKNMIIAGQRYLTEKYMPGMTNKSTILNEANNDVAIEVNREFTPLPIANRIERENSVMKDILTDNDVKKANELVPTMMHLKTYFKTEDGCLQAVDYMIGVKTIVHPIKSESMVDNLARGTKRGKLFFNLIKLTTGEISFFKDFLFAVSRIKDDIKIKYKDNNWWSTLLRRKNGANIIRLLPIKDQIIPNSSIVISMDEVEKIKAEYGIDLMEKRYIFDLIKQYFLVSFVIVDTSIEVVYFMFDGETEFQQYSYAALERENTNSAREVKNIMQVLGRM